MGAHRQGSRGRAARYSKLNVRIKTVQETYLSCEGFYVRDHPYGYHESEEFPRFRGSNRCPHCLCAPCIILMPPPYLRGSASPHEANDEKRHALYRKFWRTLKGLGLWEDEEYLRKELRTTRDDRHDIMPDCVIKVLHTHTQSTF